jgi:hypothetical protein
MLADLGEREKIEAFVKKERRKGRSSEFFRDRTAPQPAVTTGRGS